MKSIITTGIFTASLVLTANGAMAVSPANPIPSGTQFAHTQRTYVTAPGASGQLNADLARFVQGVLGGGPIPHANLLRDVRSLPSASNYSPSYDYSSTAAVDNAASAAAEAQAASDAESQAIEEMNDTNALTASMAAAEEENDEANAATLQTEINAGM